MSIARHSHKFLQVSAECKALLNLAWQRLLGTESPQVDKGFRIAAANLKREKRLEIEWEDGEC